MGMTCAVGHELGKVPPDVPMETARLVVRKVVLDIERRQQSELHRSVLRALDRSSRNRRCRGPGYGDASPC